jgi:hypothetical protein
VLFRLARELGRTVAEIEAQMTPEEFGEWVALWSIEAREADERQMAARAQAGMEQRLARARGR